MKKALVLGVTGQDGSYLAEILLESGYQVCGLIRKSATSNTQNIDHLINSKYFSSGKFTLKRGDLLDHASIFSAIKEFKPRYIYNEADQDHVAWSYEIPAYSISTTTTSVINILEAIKILDPDIRYFQPVSSNMFGIPQDDSQSEITSHNPVSPYGIAKSATFHICKFYRESYNLNVSTGIFYNHESPRRPDEYLSRKVTKAASRIKLGLQQELILGDLSGFVDWGFAKEYMEIAKKINESNLNEDFIVGTGQLTKVEDFVNLAFKQLDMDWKQYVKTSSEFMRPVPTGSLKADISKLKNLLNIHPVISIEDLISLMIESDMKIEANNE